MRIIAALAALVHLAGPAGEMAPAAPASSARDLARKVQDFYQGTRDLRASFEQTYTYAAMGRRQVSRGTLLLKKPGRMRWDYQEPEHKVIAVVGSRLTQWEPEANQVYLDEHFDATAMSAAVTFLLGKGNLDKEFEVSAEGPGSLLLRPRRPDPRVDWVALAVGPDGQVTATRVVDGQGNVNQITLRDVRRNIRLADADFEVRVPEGARRVQAPGR